MRIEKLDENKIRIFLNMEDLSEKNIDVHTFMSNSMETQDLFLDMLDKAESELGFNTKNYKLIIEALASSDGNFVLTVTRISPAEANTSKKSKKMVKTKIKSVSPNKISSIARFNTFDDFCEFCTYVNNNITLPIEKLKSSILVSYNDNYYLIIKNLNIPIKNLKSFYSSLSEFGVCLRNAELVERKITEYGKVIFRKNAISECVKYFS